MRVIAGTFKGRRLQAPTWTGLRPTSERIRETLFNWLAPSIQGARCLDLFAGTGALGFEDGLRLVAERARKAGVEKVVFDRAGFKYHGRVRSLAEAAREAGLDF